MSWLFGKKKPKTTPNTEIEKMATTLEVLDKRERLLQKKIEQEVEKAKEALAKKNKPAAMAAMKRKKAYEEQISRLSNQRFNIEQMQMKLEEATIDMETFNAQKNGAQAIKTIYGKTTATKVDEEMDKVRDAIEDANEISAAISESLGFGNEIDETDLEDELAALEQESLDEQMLGMDTPASIPSHKVPSGGQAVKPSAAPAVDDELAALEAELNA